MHRVRRTALHQQVIGSGGMTKRKIELCATDELEERPPILGVKTVKVTTEWEDEATADYAAVKGGPEELLAEIAANQSAEVAGHEGIGQAGFGYS